MLSRFLAFGWMVTASTALAHQVPNITAEALFRSDGGYTLKISLDPRVFLSDQPTSLPPVPAEWFTSQSETEVADTWAKAGGYLQRSFELRFGETTVPLPEPQFQPMDGATNAPLTAQTAEVHILATLEGHVPAVPGGGAGFVIRFGEKANTSLILLNSVDGEPERRPQVLFPGETSRPFPVPLPSSEHLAETTVNSPSEQAEETAPEPSGPGKSEKEREADALAFIERARLITLATAIGLGVLLKWVLFPKRKTDGE